MNIASFKTEYLVIVNTKDAFCGNEQAFKNLLQSNQDMKIENANIFFKHLKIKYTLQSGQVDEENKFFHIKLILEEIDKLETFEKLLKVVRSILAKATNMQIETLWDDVSFYYANKAYPLIHEIENLMRKLITKFMLTNVGFGWTKENVPTGVSESLRKQDKKKQDKSDFLYDTDFIQLSNFLFEDYQTDSNDKLVDKINKLSSLEDIDLEELKSYIPKSNWERYFSDIVDCEQEYLHKRWKQLYDLRCKIAHNNKMNREDFERTKKLVDETKEKLQSAIDNLDKLSITIEEKENITENMLLHSDMLYGKFLNTYKRFEKILYDYASSLGLESNNGKRYLRQVLIDLYEGNHLEDKTYKNLKEISSVRNKIIHSSYVNYSVKEIESYIKIMENVVNYFTNIDDVKHSEEFCVCCKEKIGMYPYSNGGLLCEACSQHNEEYELCTTCGKFYDWGELVDGITCPQCNKLD